MCDRSIVWTNLNAIEEHWNVKTEYNIEQAGGGLMSLSNVKRGEAIGDLLLRE